MDEKKQNNNLKNYYGIPTVVSKKTIKCKNGSYMLNFQIKQDNDGSKVWAHWFVKDKESKLKWLNQQAEDKESVHIFGGYNPKYKNITVAFLNLTKDWKASDKKKAKEA